MSRQLQALGWLSGVLLVTRVEGAAVWPRASSGSGSSSTGSSVAIWVPIVVVAVLILVAVLFRLRRNARRAQPGAIPTNTNTLEVSAARLAGQTDGVREVTADQLVGRTTPTGGATTTTTTPAARRTAARRNRRTPSQISTKSLPAYNKEPGEQEVVIYRGQEDMEDEHEAAPAPVRAMTTLQETDSARGSLDVVTQQGYDQEPHETIDTPLMQEHHDFPDTSALNLPAPDADVGRPSMDTLAMSDESTTSLLGGQQRYSDPRGAAPAYYEVVLNDPPIARPATTPPVATSPPPASPTTTGSRRASTLRGFFSNLGGTHARPPIPPIPADGPAAGRTHARTGSAVSAASSARPTHRPSHSGSSSRHLTSALRLHRMGSSATLASGPGGAGLTSPSLISLHSISSPLSHTLMRTEIVYPKSGPTPEQITLISSRESLGRFGVPYGAEAVAFAASRHELELPPPEFESLPDVVARRSTSDEGARPSVSVEGTPDASPDPASDAPPASSTAASSSSPSAPPPEVEIHPASPTAPPTAFRPNPSTLRRPSSVATTLSFATAQESLSSRDGLSTHAASASRPTSFAFAVEPPTPSASHPPSEDEDEDESESDGSRPGTPVTPRHAAEGTDATVRPPKHAQDAVGEPAMPPVVATASA